MKRGDVYWVNLGGSAGRRPAVIVTRSDAIPVRTRVTIAPATTTIRGIKTELAIGPEEGLRRRSVVSCDDLATVAKRLLGRKVGALTSEKLAQLDDALRFALAIRS